MLEFLLFIDRAVGDLPDLKLNDQKEVETVSILIKNILLDYLGRQK